MHCMPETRIWTRACEASAFVKDVEGLLITAAQCYIPLRRVRPLIRISKLCTRKYSYYAYMICLGSKDAFTFAKTVIIFYSSRYLNTTLKTLVQQPRPYNEYPETIAYFDKCKHSLSFPSQSIQTLWIIRHAFYISYDDIPMYISQIYFILLLTIVSTTRMYRGLHYLHDIAGSILIANILCIFI